MRLYVTAEWCRLRLSALERDGYTCTVNDGKLRVILSPSVPFATSWQAEVVASFTRWTKPSGAARR